MNHRTYKFSIRVPYAHIDQMGVVYYANYFIYMEMARSELLRDAGTPYPEMEKKGVLLPVVSAHCDYRRGARYDDLVFVFSRCTEIRGPRLKIEYEIRRPKVGTTTDGNDKDSDLLATGYTEHVCITRDGKVLKPVDEIRRLVDLE